MLKSCEKVKSTFSTVCQGKRLNNMFYIKPLLTPEELDVLNELIGIACVGCPKPTNVLNQRQIAIGKKLKEKRYISLGKNKFVVLIPID